jgi:DNA repair protein RecO (recombination protein O)
MPYDVVRSSVGLFIAEVTMKSIRETEPNPALFEFLFETFVKLDDPTIPVTHFHLFFLRRFSGYLGFMPGGDEFEEMEFFDLKEGVFMVQEPVHRLYAQGTEVSLMQTLMQAEWFDLTEIKSHSSERKKLLEHLINYYKYHIDGMGDIHAHHILAEVL